MRLAILGAGAVGPAAAALAASRGHEVALWSPSGAGTRGLGPLLHGEGALAGSWPVRVAATLPEALEGAEAALLAVPAYAFPGLLPRIAAVLPAGVTLLVSPAASLAPLAFDALWASVAGPRRAPVGALATTPCTARRIGPDRVRVIGLRAAVDVAALPAAAAPEVAALAHTLFGHECPLAPDALQPALANANPIIHAPLALANVSRIERGETWPQYGLMTEATCRLMTALAEERAALAAAFGHAVPDLDESLHRASAVPRGPLHEMGAAIQAKGATVNGPASMDTRYVTEDVPYGLAFYTALSEAKGVPMPRTRATITVMEALWGMDLSSNPLLAGLDLHDIGEALRAGYGRAR